MTEATTMGRGRGRFVAATLALVVLLAACDWPQFGYDATHTHYNPTETAIGVGNIGTLGSTWTATTGTPVTSSPAVANGVTYVVSGGTLYAFSAAGTTRCSGTPKSCAPLWTAPTGATGPNVESSPAVANGIVYVGSGSYSDGTLYAYDAAGTTNCSGTPKTCGPLWTATISSTVLDSPAVANGVVYVGSGDGTLSAFSAAGTTGCSGIPKTCAPLWTATSGGGGFGSPAVANGVVYVGSGAYGFAAGRLSAFSASGTTNCSGTPKTCAPLWTATTGRTSSSPAVANGTVYVSSSVGGSSSVGTLFAFDATGTTNCSGTPKTCAPLWTATINNTVLSSPAVANGVVYVGSAGDAKLYAFSAVGTTNCSGTPKTCAPLWTASTLTSPRSSPAVANGVVYVGSGSYLEGKLRAFDAAGHTNCSGTPKTCAPLWITSFGDDVVSSPAVANGVVYVGSLDHKLYAFGL